MCVRGGGGVVNGTCGVNLPPGLVDAWYFSS